MCSNFLSRMCGSGEPQFPGRHGISRVRHWYSTRPSLTKLREFARLGRLNVFLDLRYFQFKMGLIYFTLIANQKAPLHAQYPADYRG